MAEITLFHYQAGDSHLHQMDVRKKSVLLVLTGGAILTGSVPGFIVFGIVLLFVLIKTGMSFSRLLREAKLFFLIIAVVFLTRFLFTPGKPVVSWFVFSPTIEGFISGLHWCLRFFYIIILGQLFLVTTSLFEFKKGLSWFFSWIPGLSEQRIALMMGLVLSFIPKLMDEMETIRSAQKSRGIENRKNPVRNIRLFTLSLLRRTIIDAETLAEGLEARCYHENALTYWFSHCAYENTLVLTVALFDIGIIVYSLV